MSYARFSDGDVYVFPHVDGYVQCCGCILGDKWDFHSPDEVVAHMHEHAEAGHLVHEHLLDRETYGPRDFIGMCTTFMCREDTGHDGPHTPHRPISEAPFRCACGLGADDPVHADGSER